VVGCSAPLPAGKYHGQAKETRAASCSTLSNQLQAEFGSSFTGSNVSQIIGFAEVFPDHQIVSTLSRQFN
jgi:hypothetical protein